MSTPLSRHALACYALFGLPLGMVPLAVYLQVPQLYAMRFDLSLALVGAVLLATRLIDACTDPWIGSWIAGSNTRNTRARRALVLALPLLGIGFTALFLPPAALPLHPAAWLAAALVLVHAGYSLAGIAYHSWGAALTQDEDQRVRITATREGWTLAGVLLAAAAPVLLGIVGMTAAFLVLLPLGGALLLVAAPDPPSSPPSQQADTGGLLALRRNPLFLALLGVFAVNGIAAALPATLFLFFVQDRLQLGPQAGLLLVLYFVGGIASMPLWRAAATRLGEARAWLASMLLAVAVFVWTWWLPPGSGAAFAAICLLAGAALGADLALPPALLAAVIARAGHQGREAAYFGVWNWVAKLNLALAAGLALPLLGALGYRPGAYEAGALHALGIAYALLPCVLKLSAALLLWRSLALTSFRKETPCGA